MSLSKDDGNGNDDVRNNNLIGWMRKNNRAARAARTLEQFFVIRLPIDDVKFPNLRFKRQRRFYQSICNVLCQQ